MIGSLTQTSRRGSMISSKYDPELITHHYPKLISLVYVKKLTRDHTGRLTGCRCAADYYITTATTTSTHCHYYEYYYCCSNY